MAFKMKGFGQPKKTDDTNNMTKGAAAMMNQSLAMAYKAPIKQVADDKREVAGKDPRYAYNEAGEQIGIVTEGGGVRQPTRSRHEAASQGTGAYYTDGKLDIKDYAGKVVMGEGDVIRGFKDDKGKYTAFENPTTRERLTKKQQQQLASFERERDIFNASQERKRKAMRTLEGYTGPYANK